MCVCVPEIQRTREREFFPKKRENETERGREGVCQRVTERERTGQLGVEQMQEGLMCDWVWLR